MSSWPGKYRNGVESSQLARTFRFWEAAGHAQKKAPIEEGAGEDAGGCTRTETDTPEAMAPSACALKTSLAAKLP